MSDGKLKIEGNELKQGDLEVSEEVFQQEKLLNDAWNQEKNVETSEVLNQAWDSAKEEVAKENQELNSKLPDLEEFWNERL